ncbi:hypothetical protein B4135_0650 [Caldibacillus debilis]|uniref:Uncharacterized protein n=1 Tax=Caldibacillus debilis TaxID=301148 RepID=A0A150MF58_9BACI|nr:hypothetical protein B4135_0650 [Caldibacillus debilis]
MYFSQKSVAKGKKPLLISIFFCGKEVRGNGRSCKKNRKRKRKESAENREFETAKRTETGAAIATKHPFLPEGGGNETHHRKNFLHSNKEQDARLPSSQDNPAKPAGTVRAPQGFSSAGHLFTPAGFGQRSPRRRRKIFLRTRIDI